MKPTPAQRDILEKLASGEWELDGTSHFSPPRLQKGGLGREGETQALRSDTVYTLYRRGWIRQRPGSHFPSHPYDLTDAGRRALSPEGDPEAKADPPKPKIRVWQYRGRRNEAPGTHKQTTELIAAPSRAAAIRAFEAALGYRVPPPPAPGGRVMRDRLDLDFSTCEGCGEVLGLAEHKPRRFCTPCSLDPLWAEPGDVVISKTGARAVVLEALGTRLLVLPSLSNETQEWPLDLVERRVEDIEWTLPR